MPVARSMLLLLDLANRAHPCHGPRLDAVAAADIRTSLADARTALCVETGEDLDVIDPASGHARRCPVQWCSCGCGTTRQRCLGLGAGSG